MAIATGPVSEESFTNAMRRARSAINLLADLKIPPSPNRFTVAYAHQQGEISDLSLAMNRLISHDRLTGAAVDELYTQYFDDNVDRHELNFASQKVQDTVTEVSDQVAASRQRHEGFSTHLQNFVTVLNEDHDGILKARTEELLHETGDMTRDQRQLEERLSFALRELDTLRRHLDRLERESRKDPLTGIGNRAFFDAELRSAIAISKRDSEPVCVLMIDIDFFKAFNDQHGHQMGDQVLKLVARQLSTVGNAESARYGGEEFVLILRRCSLENAVVIADRLRRQVAGRKVVNRRTGETLGQVTLSIGVAGYRAGETGAELVHRADEAMYQAKAEGRNRVVTEDHLPLVP